MTKSFKYSSGLSFVVVFLFSLLFSFVIISLVIKSFESWLILLILGLSILLSSYFSRGKIELSIKNSKILVSVLSKPFITSKKDIEISLSELKFWYTHSYIKGLDYLWLKTETGKSYVFLMPLFGFFDISEIEDFITDGVNSEIQKNHLIFRKPKSFNEDYFGSKKWLRHTLLLLICSVVALACLEKGLGPAVIMKMLSIIFFIAGLLLFFFKISSLKRK